MAERCASFGAWTAAGAGAMFETTNRTQEVSMSRFARATAIFFAVVLLRASPVLLLLGFPIVIAALWRLNM